MPGTASTQDPEHWVDRTVPAAHVERALDRPRDELLRFVHGGQGVTALGQRRGDRRREDAATSVGVRRVDSRRLKLDELDAVEIVVDGELVVCVATFEDRGTRTKRDEVLRGLAALSERANGPAEQHLSLGKVRRDHGGKRKEPRAQRI